nr:transposase family protein [Mesorhizobium sp. DCY119]
MQTVVLTDIATGWTECVPVRTRDSGNVIVAIKQARSLFPFPLLGVDFDNDSAFMNALVVSWCRNEDLEVTRSRAYRKNDQAHVEQKNGAIVRRLVGYGRLSARTRRLLLTSFMRWCGLTAICSSRHSSCRRRRGSAPV